MGHCSVEKNKLKWVSEWLSELLNEQGAENLVSGELQQTDRWTNWLIYYWLIHWHIDCKIVRLTVMLTEGWLTVPLCTRLNYNKVSDLYINVNCESTAMYNYVYVFPGCSRKNDDKTCYKCRVVKKAGENQCLDECVSPNMINKAKECVGEYLYLPFND